MSNLNLNNVFLAGHITADPELKQTNSGTPVCTFDIAINHRKPDGNQVVEFFRITAWKKQAETVCRYFRKGSSICIRGKLSVRCFQDREGRERRNVEVDAYEIFFVDSKNAAQQNGDQPGYAQFPQEPKFEELKTDDDLPF